MSQRGQGGQWPIRNPREDAQDQARPMGQRSNLPSQQRVASQTNRQPDPRMRSQDDASQWPLRNENARTAANGSQKGPPPPRPPRPNQAPLLFHAPRPANNIVPAQIIPQYRQDPPPPPTIRLQQEPSAWEEDEHGSPTYPAPNLARPLTGSSFASTSSNYSLPDFPVPQIPEHVQQTQNLSQIRRPPLGPPPSARRGPSSYYPQGLQHAFVPPIVEETDSIYRQSTRAPHDSFGSSNAIPIGISQSYLQDRHPPPVDTGSPFDERYEEHSDSDNDQVQEISPVPMRQASVGKRSRPTMTTIKSSDSTRPDSQPRPLSVKTINSLDSHKIGAPVENVPMIQLTPSSRPARPADPVRARTTSSGVLTADEPCESEKSLQQKRSRELLAAAREQVRTRSPLAQATSGTDDDSYGAEKGFDFGIEERLEDPEKKGSLAARVGSRRPPRLNVDAVKEAEARGSLTSLPDLIRRATRLASNLDRGRTASRLGMDWFGDEGRKSPNMGEKRQSKNSLSDILASFPPPGLATPPGSRGSRGMGQWPSHLRHSALHSESDLGEEEEQQRRKRTCCGMPLWLFLMLLLVVLLVVAAAIVIPIVLVVIPNQNKSTATSSSALASCQKSLSCENGGSSIVGTDGSCGCLCVNGFTGTQCGEESITGCATTNIDNMSNVTLGDAIPRLFEGAQTNFSVTLNGSTLLNLFSSNNLSCSSENALVTFNGLSARSLDGEIGSIAGMLTEAKLTPTTTLNKREDATSSADAVATSNSIIYDNSPTSTSPASSSSTTAVNSASISNSTMLDFARVAVLFVLQDSGDVGNAATAQENLQDYFTSGTTSVGATIDVTNITLAGGYTANLQEHTITTASGSHVGG